MKHLHESIFDPDFDGDIPYMKLPHLQDYQKVLDKIKRRKGTIQEISPRDISEFMDLLKNHNKLLAGPEEYYDWFDHHRTNSDCFAVIYRELRPGRVPGFIDIIDSARKIRIRLSVRESSKTPYESRAYSRSTYDNYVYEIDPRLIDLLDYTLF